MMAVVPPMDLLDESLIAGCVTFPQALGVSRAMSRRKPTDGSLSESLGVQKSVWSRIQHKPKDSPAYMPEDRYEVLCEALGNVGVIQWLAYRTGHRLVPMAETEAQKLRRRLAELEAAESSRLHAA